MSALASAPMGRLVRRRGRATGIVAAVLLLALGCRMDILQGESDKEKARSVAKAAKAITAFSFAALGVEATIDENSKTIAATVPFGTNVTALVATFTTTGASVKVGSKVQTSGVTANNFTKPVVYKVTASNGSMASYTMTLAVAPSSFKAITQFEEVAVSYR